MRRRPSFRRDTELHREIRRINKLVQNKQSRLRVNKGLEVVDIETKKVSEFNSRREINKYLKQMQRFLERNADFRVVNEKGATLQYSEIQDIEKTIARVNRQKKAMWDRVKNLPYLHKGQPTGLTVGQQADPEIGIGDPKYEDFKPIKFNAGRFRTEQEFKKWAEEKRELYKGNYLQKQYELYRENYIKSLENNLGNASKHLQEIIRNMPLDDFIIKYYTENNAHIDFVYDQLAVNTRVRELERIWLDSGDD